MYAFAPVAPVTAAKPAIGSSSFAAPLAARPVSARSAAPTMVLRTALRVPTGTGTASVFGGFAAIQSKAEDYMTSCVKKQYIQMTMPTGTFGVQCTEGSISGAAEVSRVRALGSAFRAKQASPFKKYFDLYEHRKSAYVKAHECSYEEGLFQSFPKMTAAYNLAQTEYTGACARYASPETVEEAAMMRYMDIQTKMSVNPTGVYNTACNEGSVKGQAEDIRVAALNAAYRQGQKSVLSIMNEKYQQKKAGYIASHGCNYEEGIVSNYPAVGASFRSKAYGY